MTKHHHPFPPAVLEQHTGVVGKTGSGKTITAKAAVEQAFDGGSHICVLDPIKSDWWGLTLAADGKKPGLPFHILGGPYGHVPLHASAGAALGRIVGDGSLPYSILDMAEFGPGEHNQFFSDFAEALFKTKQGRSGVLYLVLEEAHVFCPKERDGTKGENMAIFWMKRIASAARSKGIRMIAVTQRTQALHNAVLGSCDSLIAHRLTLPADQKPIVEWLKGNLAAEKAATVAGTLSSQKTGEGWLCSGEAQLTVQMKFPMIRTYDNSATPTGKGAELSVRPPPVDQENLRAIIGTAVKEAEDNDPKLLKAKLAEANALLAEERELRSIDGGDAAAAVGPSESEAQLVRDLESAQERVEQLEALVEEANGKINGLVTTGRGIHNRFQLVAAHVQQEFASVDLDAQSHLGIEPIQTPHRTHAATVQTGRAYASPTRPSGNGELTSVRDGNARGPHHARGAADGAAGSGDRPSAPAGGVAASSPRGRILHALAWWRAIGVQEPSRAQVGFIAGYAETTKTFRNCLGEMRGELLEYTDSGVVATAEGWRQATKLARPPSLEELHGRVRRTLNEPQTRIFDLLVSARGKPLSRSDLARGAGYAETTKTFRNNLSELRTLGLIDYPSASMAQASPLLFPEGLR